MFLMRVHARERVYVCVCVVHWHCTAQMSMFNMEKRYRNQIIIIIIIISHIYKPFDKFLSHFQHSKGVSKILQPVTTNRSHI